MGCPYPAMYHFQNDCYVKIMTNKGKISEKEYEEIKQVYANQNFKSKGDGEVRFTVYLLGVVFAFVSILVIYWPMPQQKEWESSGNSETVMDKKSENKDEKTQSSNKRSGLKFNPLPSANPKIGWFEFGGD